MHAIQKICSGMVCVALGVVSATGCAERPGTKKDDKKADDAKKDDKDDKTKDAKKADSK
jgi:hypothetical protein